MSLKESLRKKLNDDQYNAVLDALGDDFNYDVVPRTRLNDVIKQRDGYKAQIEGVSSENTNEEGEKKEVKSHATTPDIETLKAQWLKEQGDAVTELKIKYMVLDNLRAAKCIDPEIVYNSGIIDKKAITVDEQGNIQGAKEAVDALVQSKANLFGETVPTGTGKSSGDDDYKVIKTKDDFLKLTFSDQISFKKAHPEVFKTFLNN